MSHVRGSGTPSSAWIEFVPPDDPQDLGWWVKCPRCGKRIRNLRMARGSHAAWCLKHSSQSPSRPEDRP